MSLLSYCPYCYGLMTLENKTKEHLVPACFGGVNIVYVCRGCNSQRGNSFSDRNFLSFIRRHPSLFSLHVEQSSNDFSSKQKLLSLLHVVHPSEIQSVYSFLQLKHMGRSTIGTLSLELSRTSDLVRQYVALEMARLGSPVLGGRASQAVHRCMKRMENRRNRQALKRYSNKVKNKYNNM